MDASNMELTHYSKLANVTNLAAPVDIIMILNHPFKTASPALIKQINILQFIWMEVEFVRAVRLPKFSTCLHHFGSGYRIST
jgi:hypothetical protein